MSQTNNSISKGAAIFSESKDRNWRYLSRSQKLFFLARDRAISAYHQNLYFSINRLFYAFGIFVIFFMELFKNSFLKPQKCDTARQSWEISNDVDNSPSAAIFGFLKHILVCSKAQNFLGGQNPAFLPPKNTFNPISENCPCHVLFFFKSSFVSE